MIFTADYFKQPRIKRIGTLIHEARHSDGDRHLSQGVVDHDHPDTAHGQCLTGSLTGATGPRLSEDGCEAHFDGAYSYEAVFHFNVQKSCTSCSAEERQQAGTYGRDALFNHHREIPDLSPR